MQTHAQPHPWNGYDAPGPYTDGANDMLPLHQGPVAEQEVPVRAEMPYLIIGVIWGILTGFATYLARADDSSSGTIKLSVFIYPVAGAVISAILATVTTRSIMTFFGSFADRVGWLMGIHVAVAIISCAVHPDSQPILLGRYVLLAVAFSTCISICRAGPNSKKVPARLDPGI